MEVISISKILGHSISFIVTYYLSYKMIYYLWSRKEKVLFPSEKDAIAIISFILTLFINYIGVLIYYDKLKIVW